MPKGFIDKDMGMEEFLKQVHRAKGKSYTKVGLPFENEPIDVSDEENGHKSQLELVQIAAVHEFGAPNRNIPERSFLRSTVDNKREEIDSILTTNYKRYQDGKISLRIALGQIGEYVTNQVQTTIRNRIPPELKPETIRRKTVQGKVGDVPLIDTGQLIQSISHVEVLQNDKKV